MTLLQMQEGICVIYGKNSRSADEKMAGLFMAARLFYQLNGVDKIHTFAYTKHIK